MKKNWLITQIFLSVILAVIVASTFAAGEKLVDVQQFALEQQRANLRAQEEATRQHEETVSSSTMSTQQAGSATENKKVTTQNNNTLELNKKNLPTCDCYEPNSVYNYPDNYFYNDQRVRTYQIKPACECLKTAPVVTTEPAPTTAEQTKDYVESKENVVKDTSTKNDWGIRYR